MARFHTLYTAIQVVGPVEEDVPTAPATYGGGVGKRSFPSCSA